MITLAMLTGQSSDHLVNISESHRLQAAAAEAFLAMQQAAQHAGFDLQPASTFRDFARQQAIWNGKFNGQRPVLDSNGQVLDAAALPVDQRCQAILRWSALPGASRHHWGTDLDIYDPSLLPVGTKLQLENWEYEPGGYFAGLTAWLSQHMAHYGFYRPYAKDTGGVAVEPWHLSYRPLAEQAQHLLTPELLLQAWQGQEIAGFDWLRDHLPAIFARFIRTAEEE